MRFGYFVGITLFVVAGCAEPQPYLQPQYMPQATYPMPYAPPLLASNWTVQPSQPVDLATSSRECTRLIGSINAGLAHVTATGLRASEEGKDSFAETSVALSEVGRAIEEQVYQTPDLVRLGGFFIGIVRNQARILADVAATPDGDDTRLAALQGQLATLYEQEDRLLAELNLLCRGSESPEPTAPTAPTQPAVPGPVPTPNP